jgi:2,4-dienoyl-CoA reductase-like NADH-dependent reductase (Old Yellow Enzyme family)
MRNRADRETRRQFLKLAAAGTASIVVAPSLATKAAMGQNQGRGHYKLYSKGSIGTMRLKNRLVRSAAFEAAAAPGPGADSGKVTEGYVKFHRRLAEGGIGLIITGYMAPMEQGFLRSQIGAFDDRFIPGLAKVAEAVHAVPNGCKIVAEIGHGGMGIGPSGIFWPTKNAPKIMTTEDVGQFCTAMADATRRVKQAGFDGMEIHGAHHYLVNAFLSPYSNRRTDKYGGSLFNRVEIVREMVGKIRDRVGPDYPILIKLNCDDGPVDDGVEGEINLDTFPKLVKLIVDTGVDAIDVSGQQFPGDPLRMHLGKSEDQSFFEPYARALDVKTPVILGCGNKNVELLEKILQKDDRIDFVSFARPLIREPDLPNRWLEGRGPATVNCISCNLCYNRIGQEGLTHCWQLGKPGLERGGIVA